MNGYIAYFRRKRIEIEAEDLAKAKIKALAEFKPSKRDEGLVAVVLAEKNGKQVIHNPAEFG